MGGGLKQVRDWSAGAILHGRLRNISWAITDQILFAGSNFALGLLTARWMDAPSFAALATALVIQTFIISLYEAAFTEPMTVFGAGKFRDRFGSYIGALLVGHAALGVAICLCVVIFALLLSAFGVTVLLAAFLGLALSTPFVLSRYLARKACYAISRPRAATASGLVYSVVLLGGIAMFGSDISLANVFFMLAFASMLSAGATYWTIRPVYPDRAILLAAPTVHWFFARWTLGTAFIAQAPQIVWYLVLPIWAGWEANAVLRAVSILNLLVGHSMSAVQMVLLPALIKAHRSDASEFDRLSLASGIGILCVSIIFWLLMVVLGEPILDLMYDGKYVEHAGLLVILSLSPVAWGLTVVCSARAHAAERPDLTFRGAFLGLIATVPGLLLIYFFGLTGAVMGIVLVGLAPAALLLRSTWGDPSGWPRARAIDVRRPSADG